MSRIAVNKLANRLKTKEINVDSLIDNSLRSLKPSSVLPSVRDNGSPLEVGDTVTNLTDGFEYKYTGTGWLSTDIAFLVKELAKSTGAGTVGFDRSPISAIIGSLAKAITGLSISIWEYDNLVTVRPTPTDPTTWNWTPALQAAINATNGIKHTTIVVPLNVDIGMVTATGKHNWSITGGGKLRKITANPMLSLYGCNNVNIYNLRLDGNIVWDEATNGSILPGVGRTAYGVGVYAQECNDLKIYDCDIFDFANDPISIRGKYTGGVPGTSGATLVTASERIVVARCNIYNYRNTAIYLAGVKNCTVMSNQIYTTDAFGYIRGNGIYLVDWCESITCIDNKMLRIGDNGIGVGEVGNPLAQNKKVSLISNSVDRCVYMCILVAGGEDVLVYDNTLTRGMMQQALVPEAFILAGNPGALQVKGGNTSKTKRIQVISNTVDQSYQRGIYVFDDAAVSKANWTSGVEVSHNIVRRSQQENIYINMALSVTVNFNQSSEGLTTGIFVSGSHDLFMNRSFLNTGHGILSSQLNTFTDQDQNPTISHNRCRENGLNGIQIIGGSLARAQILHNKCKGNGSAGTTVGGKSGIRANGLHHPLIQGNECSDNYGPGILVDSCTRFVVDNGNMLTNNGVDSALPQNQRAGIYVMCTATAFREGRLMSNKMFAGLNQQVGYAAEFDTSTLLIAIGNEPDAHPILPQNILRKTWANIYNNE